MPTARQVSVTKKQKLQDNDENTAEIRTEDSVSFATLIDRDYPTELIAENLLRMLNYDSLQGLGELLSVIVCSAGCKADFTLIAEPSNSEIDTIAEQIEASCLRSTEGCPASFPFQKLEFSKRVANLVETVVSAMYDAGERGVLALVSRIVARLTTAHLQSLRLVATSFAGTIMNAYHDTENGEAAQAHARLVSAVAARAGDVSAAIRRRAVADIVLVSPGEAARALNDTNGTVRLAAVRSLSLCSATDDEEPQDAENAPALSSRIEEMAVRDVDLPVRRAALKYLHAKGRVVENSAAVVQMMQDTDEQSRKMAAELIVKKESRETSSAQMLVVALSELSKTPVMATALAHALEKAKSLFHVRWSEQIAIVLTSDYDKDARKTKLAAPLKQEYRALAKHMSNDGTRLRTTALLAAVLAISKTEDSAFLSYIPGLLQRAQHSDPLLAGCLRALSNLNFVSLMARGDGAKLSAKAYDLVRDIFMERSGGGRQVAEAISKFFASIPETSRTRLLEDIYQDLRIKLAGILGAAGTLGRGKGAQLKNVVMQLIVVGRFIDISDLFKLPLWSSLAEGNVYTLQLVRAIGMKGTAETVKLAVKRLSERKCGPAVDDILRLYVSAKMRGVDVDMALPLDVNDTAPTSEATWRAAVAASVI